MTKRRHFVAGNWKMFKTIPEALELVKGIRAGLEQAPGDHDVLAARPSTARGAVAASGGASPVQLGGQTMHWEKEGAFTGETPAAMLRDAGCSHVILGHSERRHIFGETDDGVGRKARAALD